MATTWIIQAVTERSSESLAALRDAILDLGLPLFEVRVIPFSGKLPEMPEQVDRPFLLYGYNTLIQSTYRHEKWQHGLFYDEHSFTTATYTQALGDQMLNHDSQVLTCKELFESDLNATDRFFLRPNDDSKLFTGQVMSFRDYWRWYEKLDDPENIELKQDTLVVCSKPKTILAEYRTFILEGKVLGSSQYLPNIAQFTQPEVISFAEHIAGQNSPAAAFVCDIARTDDGLKVIEFNCINGSGFYKADVRQVVSALSRWQELH